MGRVISYGEKTGYNDGDYLLIDNGEGGTKRIRADRVGIQLDPTLLDPNKAAPANTVKPVDAAPTQGSSNAVSSGGVKSALDAVTAQIPQIDPTLSQSGQAADAEAAGKVKNGLNTIIYGGDYDYPIAWIDGYYINNNTGEAEVYTNWICTDFIEIDPNTIVKTTTTATNGTGYNAFYSDNKSFLQKFTNANSALTIPNNAKYMRLSCRKIEKVTVSFAMQSGMIDFNGCLAEQGDEW